MPFFATAAMVFCMQICIPAAGGPIVAQEGSRKPPAQEDIVRLTARVIDGRSERGLLGAVIELSGIVDRYVTGVDGRAGMEVPKGRYTLTARRGRYEVLTGDLDVFEAGEFTISLARVGTMDATATATLEVRVVDHRSGAGIEGARVSILEGPGDATDAGGYVEFSGLDMLVAEISVEASGYATRAAPVAMHPFRTAAVRVALTEEGAAPQPVEVVVRTRAMDILSRNVGRRGERVALFTRRTLEDLAVEELSEALATLDGFRVERPRPDEAELVAPRNCTLGVRVDGIGGRSDRNNIDVVPIHLVERVEVQLHRRRGCGFVFIWTRRGRPPVIFEGTQSGNLQQEVHR